MPVEPRRCLSLGTRSGRKKFEYCPRRPTILDKRQNFFLLFRVAFATGGSQMNP